MQVLILSDCSPTANMLESLVDDALSSASVCKETSENSIHSLLDTHNFDLVLLDISNIHIQTGLEVGKSILHSQPYTEIIIVSACPDCVLESFEIHPYDFFIKPINVTKFNRSLKAVEGLIHSRQSKKKRAPENDRLLIKSKKEIHWIPYGKIHFIEKLQKDIYIHTESDVIQLRQNISDILGLLPSNFLRVHKSYIVNADHIAKIVEHGDRSYEIYFLSSTKTAYMSRYQAPVLLDQLD